jgi:hypothetical protein
MTFDEKKALLEYNGWVVECESPFEIRHGESGSFATGRAAHMVADQLEQEKYGDCALITVRDDNTSNSELYGLYYLIKDAIETRTSSTLEVDADFDDKASEYLRTRREYDSPIKIKIVVQNNNA